MNDPVGSKWRKWDLHFHTPASFDYTGGRPSAQDIVRKLLDASIAAVAVTDHHCMDVAYIKEMQNHAGMDLTVFPGIELRSEFGGNPVHYIGIFPEDTDLPDLWDTLKGSLGLTRSHLTNKGGHEKVYVPLADAHKVMSEELGGLITIHAGAKSNSIEEIRNYEQFQQRLKLDITRDYVDFLEVGQLKDVLDYLDIVFPATGLDTPLIIGSDNHRIAGYAPPPCWIKADPTFTGLRQVVNEPRDRVFLGGSPPQRTAIEDDPTRFVRSISISKKPNSTLGEHWFEDVSIGVNQGLVAVVGKQGSGKSALTDVLGLLGWCPHEESFAFLNEEQFRHPKGNKAAHFHATLRWADGASVEADLSDSVPDGSHETIKYIPQFHLDEICDELRGGQGGKFEEELKSVIFSRIPRESRARKQTLDELIDFRTRDARETIASVQEEIAVIADKFGALEEKCSAAYRTNLESQLALVEKKIKAHIASKPDGVKRPEDSDHDGQAELRQALKEVDEEIGVLDERIRNAQSDLGNLNERLEIVSQVSGLLANFLSDVDRLRDKLFEDLERLDIAFADLVTVDVDQQPLNELREAISREKQNTENLLAEEGEESLIVARNEKRDDKEKLREQLNQPAREYAAWQQALEKWKERLDELEGDGETAGTKKYLETKLNELSEVPQDISQILSDLRGAAKRILEAKQKILNVSEALHAPVREFISEHAIAGEQFGLEFFVSFVPQDFSTRILDFVDQGRRGSFYGESGGRERIQKLLRAADFSEIDGVMEFLGSVLHSLRHDVRNSDEAVLIADQIRQGFSAAEVLEYVFGLSYLEPRFELRWHGRPLAQLSPGERGTLLLIFFLLIDDAKVPLVIDQPEGNLDNQTVYELLVHCIKDAKRRRQIIIATHNPNLAVVCDAEQVILSRLEKADDNRVTYECGALENPDIGNRIVDVLEGTRPAIENRMAKYRIIFDRR